MERNERQEESGMISHKCDYCKKDMDGITGATSYVFKAGFPIEGAGGIRRAASVEVFALTKNEHSRVCRECATVIVLDLADEIRKEQAKEKQKQ